jgi:nicotinamidase-related amidase
MNIQKIDTAVVFIDPQNDVLSPRGANWAAVGASVTENRTVENMERRRRSRTGTTCLFRRIISTRRTMAGR